MLKARGFGLVLGFIILMISFILSITLGATKIPFSSAIESFFYYDITSNEHVIIRMTRLPRAIIASLIGANLAVAGALMQALTRNPLASPSIFGINAGAVFFVVLALAVFPLSSVTQLIWIAFLGAGIAALIVYLLGSMGRGGLTPVKVVLAGAAVSALFTSFTQGMLALDESGLQNVLFWLAGSVAGRATEILLPVLPYMIAAGVVALCLGRSVNILAAGDEVAKGLGQRTILVKVVMAVTIILLAGSSVAVAGSIGFVGLVVPHIVRFLVGIDYRWIIPYSALLGAILLLLADLAARFIIMPGEIPIGVMTALIGVPFFIYMARKSIRSEGMSS